MTGFDLWATRPGSLGGAEAHLILIMLRFQRMREADGHSYVVGWECVGQVVGLTDFSTFCGWTGGRAGLFRAAGLHLKVPGLEVCLEVL